MKQGKPKAKAVKYKRKTPLYYNPAREQEIMRVRSQGRCECDRPILNGGVDRCPNLHNEEARNGRRGPTMLSILFLGKKHDYTKAVAWCNFCQWENAKLISKRPPCKRKAKVEPGQVGMFE